MTPSLTLWILITTIGACLGSFIALVCDRYPLMLYRDWQIKPPTAAQQRRLAQFSKRFNLAYPASHCSHCQSPIAWYHNLPILSMILLRGQCANCHQSIPWQNLAIECFSAILAIVLVNLFGWHYHTIAFAIVVYSLLTLTIIDATHTLLPDTITLTLLWLGLLWQLTPWSTTVSSQQAILGATIGYGIPWLIGKLFLLIRHKIGLGLGDCKLLAAVGAWGGPISALITLFLAALISLLILIPLMVCKRINRHSAIPFGPFIAIAACAVLGCQWLQLPLNDWLMGLS